ncbi:MAG: thiamine phosphate synthase [Desulfobacterales bacterium]|nr:thiamine phosphate synthase [Desulfobacterales bacterium]MBF0396473.1 thiamine phosphate synthase [Desulfobacterales bacterium]
MDIDYSLYLVTDRTLNPLKSLFDIVCDAVYGGATIVQLREKHSSTLEFINTAMSIKYFLKKNNIPLIINDRIDVALAVKADGIHIGQDDMPLELAKSILKNSMIIGVSVNTEEEALKAQKDGADYIGVGPVFKTKTKTDTSPVIGIKGLKKIKKAVNIPIVAIGGLNKDNIFEVIKSGADGIAVVSAIVCANDCKIASKELKDIINLAKK